MPRRRNHPVHQPMNFRVSITARYYCRYSESLLLSIRAAYIMIIIYLYFFISKYYIFNLPLSFVGNVIKVLITCEITLVHQPMIIERVLLPSSTVPVTLYIYRFEHTVLVSFIFIFIFVIFFYLTSLVCRGCLESFRS